MKWLLLLLPVMVVVVVVAAADSATRTVSFSWMRFQAVKYAVSSFRSFHTDRQLANTGGGVAARISSGVASRPSTKHRVIRAVSRGRRGGARRREGGIGVGGGAAEYVIVVGEEVDFGEGEGVVINGGVWAHEMFMVRRRWAQVVEQILRNLIDLIH
ncbi:hypothetical protein MIMGU_mgv1a015480mg [Erythranthe guttata]|uniref:Uncharacterized protein n=1 Tax=Erythranthe guttata TaxID=4155 RepID=A0A022QZM4_ERYGU|nr:hypothetical protein MIMGU_mgv1a015480mg [Erythranthe guttata]